MYVSNIMKDSLVYISTRVYLNHTNSTPSTNRSPSVLHNLNSMIKSWHSVQAI